MADPRFHKRGGPYRLGEIASRCGARLGGAASPDMLIVDVAPLDRAQEGDLSFLDNPKYADAFAATGASACFVSEKQASRAPAGLALLFAPKPYLSYARAAQLFYPAGAVGPGCHATAAVASDARIGSGVSIGAHAVIESGAEIGNGTSIGPGAVIGRNVVVGNDCRIGSHVSLSHCLIGSRVTLHPGVRIGQDGFGFAPDPAGHVKVPQLGRVMIGDDCDIGANTTIDRGSGPDTVIGPGCWIDNLVQIGHNVTLGRGCIIIAQAGIAGSTRLDDFVVMAAQSGIAGHLHVGAGARIAAQGGVMTDIPPGESFAGSPALKAKEYFRQVAVVRRLAARKGGQDE